MNFAALETPLYAEPAFFIEPRDTSPATEMERVVAFRRDLRKALPAARIAAVPNAGKRGQAAVRQAKAEGMSAGFPDMVIFHAGRIAVLEWKNGTNKPSDAQIDWINWLCAAGFDAACVRTSAGAFSFLRSKGWPL